MSHHTDSNTKEQIEQLLEEDFIIQLMKSRVLPGGLEMLWKLQIQRFTLQQLGILLLVLDYRRLC